MTRQINESPIVQGEDEQIVYTLTTTPWGSSPASISVTAKDITFPNGTVVTATLFPAGSPSATGDVIKLPLCKNVIAGHKYRIEVKFTCSGNIFEPYCIINGEV